LLYVFYIVFQVFADQSGAEPGWMKGEHNGKSGWFPKDYLEQVPYTQSSQQSNAAAFRSG